MDEKNRTCCASFEIPTRCCRLLRRAADHGLELACDFGDWDEDVRARVLNAARMVDVFYLGTPTAFRVAELADNALRWAERPREQPLTLETLGDYFVGLGELRELIKVRDRALRHLGLPLASDAEHDRRG
jgi:uncharacterized protein YbjT (DUF2867 family)